MKKIVSLVIIGVMGFSMSSYSKELTWKERLLDYGLPCLVSFGAGMMLEGQNKTGVAIGASGCLGIGTAQYLNERRDSKNLNEEDLGKIQAMISGTVEKSSNEQKLEIDNRMKTLEEAQKNQLEEMRSVVREVLAERMMKMEDNLKIELTKKMETGEFAPKLEKNLTDSMKKEVQIKTKESQKEIIEKCVDLTIKQVIAKPVGVPENPEGLEQ